MSRQTQFKDETGNKHGRLTAIERAPNKGRLVAWYCQCDCGNKVIIAGYNLRHGDSQSCGCYRKELQQARQRIDEVGNRYGKLVVQGLVDGDNKGGCSRWHCLCDCGVSLTVSGARLRRGDKTDCGCVRAAISAVNMMKRRAKDAERSKIYRANLKLRALLVRGSAEDAKKAARDEQMYDDRKAAFNWQAHRIYFESSGEYGWPCVRTKELPLEFDSEE